MLREPYAPPDKTPVVIAGLDPAIHHLRIRFFRWMPGSSPGMTISFVAVAVQ
jgi:hypothetical protein